MVKKANQNVNLNAHPEVEESIKMFASFIYDDTVQELLASNGTEDIYSMGSYMAAQIIDKISNELYKKNPLYDTNKFLRATSGRIIDLSPKKSATRGSYDED